MSKEERMSKHAQTGDAVEILHRRYVGDDPERRAALEQLRTHANVARQIYDLRTRAGLSQKELAERIGTTQSAISRLEDADYEGHSLSMLRRIAETLGERLEVSFTQGAPSPSFAGRRSVRREI
jgi:ribosome-binding protein aMBF1 (putative translation factor)